VIHSGIYYAPGSLKAMLCTKGARLMYEFCESHGVPADPCGKLIVATTDSELPALDGLYRRGIVNGVPGLEMVGPAGIREREPHCTGIRAIWSPATGIVDFSRVAQAMADDVGRLGGTILTGHLVTGLAVRPGSILVRTSHGELSAARVLTCAGLHSDRVARLSGAPEEPGIVPFRGDYWQLRPDRRDLARNLIYPVPDPKFPFLGVHFTRRIADDAVWLGPNAVLALAREGYRRSTLRPSDLAQTLGYPGFRRMARKYWRAGAAEVYRDVSKRAFVAACQRFIPELVPADVIPGPSGVRAQSVARDGRLVDDFIINVQGTQLMHIRNAPSPAATSALAIGQMIADEWERAA
jgi:L-2-hydroxyglutarate oxidase LhgO